VLTLVVVAALALSLIVTFAFYPITRRRSEEAIMAQAKEQTHLIESVRASRTLKLMGREPEREAAWRNLFAESVNASFSVARFEIIRTALQGLINAVQTILVVYLAARTIINGDGFSVGMLFAFLSFRQTFTDRVLALINEAFNFRLLTLHLERISDIAHSEREPVPPSEPPEDAPPPAGAVSMTGIWFRYGEGDRFVLEDAGFEVRAGEFVAITGASGGGKSTLLKLMLGPYEPTRGEIRLDGKPPELAGWRAWRRHVGVVAQDDQLLSGSIADNIAFFDPDLDMARVHEAARTARLHEDIMRMPMQYLSLIGTWARRSPAGSASACCWRARYTGGPPSWCSTKARPILTKRRKRRSPTQSCPWRSPGSSSPIAPPWWSELTGRCAWTAGG